MNSKELTVSPDDLERLRMKARSALGESPALQEYLAARYVALSGDAGDGMNMALLARSTEIRSLAIDLFVRPEGTTQQRAPKL